MLRIRTTIFAKKTAGPKSQAPPRGVEHLRIALEGQLQSILEFTSWLSCVCDSPNGICAAGGGTRGATVSADNVVGRTARLEESFAILRPAIYASAVIEEPGLVANALHRVRVKVRMVEGIEEVHAEAEVEPLLEVPVLV